MAEQDPESVTSVPPYPLAMVACDAVHRDQTTGKRTLLGLFSTIRAAQLPYVHPRLAVYVALTDARGRLPVALRLVHANEDRAALFEARTEVEFGDPRAIVEIDFHVREVRFETAGEYRFQLEAAGQLLMERRILVFTPGEDEQ